MGCLIAPLDLTLSNIERSKSKSLRLQSFISRKGAQLGHMLLLNTNGKPYMGSPIALSYLTFSDLEMSNSRSLRFRNLTSHNGD